MYTTEQIQKLSDVFFELIHHAYTYNSSFEDIDALMDWARLQLIASGYEFQPMGSSWGVLQSKSKADLAGVRKALEKAGVYESQIQEILNFVEYKTQGNRFDKKTIDKIGELMKK